MRFGLAFCGALSVNFAVPFSVRRRRFSGQRFVMHFIGERVGFLGRVLVIVFVIGLLVSVLIGVQRFLQLFELGRLDKLFSDRFDRLRTLFRISLRFFVLGLGQLFGERGYVFVGKAGAIGGMRVRDHRRTCFGVEPIQIVSDFSFRVRRSFHIFRHTGGSLGSKVRNRRLMFLGNRRGRGCKKRTRQARGQLFVRKSAWRSRRGGSFS